MTYLFEFFAVGPDGERARLDKFSYRLPTVESAVLRARTIGRNVKLGDRQPHLCVIRDQVGTVCQEVGLGVVSPSIGLYGGHATSPPAAP